MKLLLIEVEVTTPLNQMDLNPDISFINQKYKNFSPEEKHKWRMPEVPKVPKEQNHLQQEALEIYQFQHKSCLMAAKKQEKDSRPSEGLETHFFQIKSPKDKTLVEKPKNLVRAPEVIFGPTEGQQPSGSSSRLHRQEYASKRPKQGQASPKEQSEGQARRKGKVKTQVEQT
ncbi:hypothetical protein O181_008535 [Austropuccinia psidii MF-1]|uniref:Uncharacterized protein n=1 Tax=Austropuccinia psidii MF-1 TaxID=1389203 RepID=A0A9Q3GIZ6_9BASI|nr:hypothetical protein [Austropuccinia psidii MF-1]